MAYKDFANDLKKEIIGSVLFLYGAEDYLIEWAIQQIIDKHVEEEYRALDVQHLDGESCSAADIMGASRAYSMFSEKRVVLVHNYLPIYRKSTDVDEDRLIDFCKENQDTCVLVFSLDSKYESDITAFGKKLIKASSSYSFDRLDKASLQAFISKRVHAAGKMLGHREMDFLIDVSGYFYRDSDYNLTKLNADLEKIVGACVDDQIDNSLIEELLVGSEDRFVFNLVDALMTGDKCKAMEIAETILDEAGASLPVLSLLAKQFEIMYDALELEKDGYSIAEMAKKTSVNEYRFKKAYQAARRFSKQRIKEVLINIYNIDRDFKMGNIDVNLAFELLIVGI